VLELIADQGHASPRPAAHAWEDPARWWPRLTEATAHLPAPVAVIDLEALRYNTMDMVVRTGGLPIRIATKSVRVREVIDAALRVPGYRGLLAFTLAEALWLAEDHDDIVLAYPTADRPSLERLLADEQAAARITLMVDDESQLDFIDAVVAPAARPRVRIAIDADASWRAPALGHIGVFRSPLHSPDEVARFARRAAERDGFRLVGLQMYEAQIAGQGDDTGSGDTLIRTVQAQSRQELRERRARIAEAVRALVPLEFVTGGGTGSLEYTGSDPALTEITAGSGLLAGHLFDGYRAFAPAPASAIAFDVVRRPAPDIATILGGGRFAPARARVAAGPADRAAGGCGRGADAAARRGRSHAPDRGPRLAAAREERRAGRTDPELPPRGRRSRRRRAAHLSR